MKNMYLHIGCGKTGSSALQVWLANNAQELGENGFCYPLFGAGKLSDYAITCGNGLPLRNAIVSKNLPEMIKKIYAPSIDNVIFSSEVFQDLEENDAKYLYETCKENNIDVHIIAYVRDVYDITYSGYLQLLKRRAYTGSFSSYALKLDNIQQFSVVSLYEKLFNNMSVIHYDTERNKGVDISFCQALGIEPSLITRMKKAIVNRSLTVKESQLVINAKRVYLGRFKDDVEKFSGFVSNTLIHSSPERETEILFQPKIMDHLKKSFESEVGYINERYLQTDQLKIFDPTDKKIVDFITAPDPDFMTMIDDLIDSFLKK